MLWERLWLLRVVCACVLLGGCFARAETLSGTVLDPQQRPIVRASVSLNCENQTDTVITDGQGRFSFTRQGLPPSCKIQAAYPGFAALELALGQRRTLTLELRLAEVQQTVDAKDDVPTLRSLTSVSLSASELKNISDNSNDLLAYARHLAGVYSGSEQIYVDGLPTNQLPQADRIESITINSDPFSAEYSDGGNTHIDIVTKSAERKFHLSSGGISLGPAARDGLNPHLTSSLNRLSLGLSGPVPDSPLAFTSDVDFTDRRREVPIEAVIPLIPGEPVSSGTAAPATDSNLLLALGTDYSKGEAFRVNASLYVATTRHTNVNVSGLTLPEAGISTGTMARELRTTITKTGGHYLYRGGIVANWLNKDLNANSSGLGVGVSGAFIAGGAQLNKEKSRGNRWTFKNVLEFDTAHRHWSVGATISRREDEQAISPNPAGYIQFDNLKDYVLSVTTGAQTGTAFIARGLGDVWYGSYIVAPFVEGEILRRGSVSIRGGLREDYQTAGGFLFSPRLSAVVALHGFVFRAGGGMFVQNWTNDMFLRVLENNGQHLCQFLITNVSLSNIENGKVTQEPEIVSRITPNLTPTRDWVSKLSVEHPFGNFVPGVEYTWTSVTHLLGSQRLSTLTGWQDLLESNRALRKQQVHFRAQYKIRSHNLTAHYEWIRARDNTDGPFSFPARQDDIQGEWGPASGIASNNLTLAANFHFAGLFSVALVDGWHSGLPLNLTSGLDAEANGLFTDRAGGPRNGGRGPFFNSLDLFAHRRIGLPKVLSETKQKVYVDVGVQGLNLLGNRDYTTIGTTLGSPLLGQPLSALPGRTVRFSLSLQR